MPLKGKRQNRIIAAARLYQLSMGENAFVHIYTDDGCLDEPGNKIASITVYFAAGNQLCARMIFSTFKS